MEFWNRTNLLSGVRGICKALSVKCSENQPTYGEDLSPKAPGEGTEENLLPSGGQGPPEGPGSTHPFLFADGMGRGRFLSCSPEPPLLFQMAYSGPRSAGGAGLGQGGFLLAPVDFLKPVLDRLPPCFCTLAPDYSSIPEQTRSAVLKVKDAAV